MNKIIFSLTIITILFTGCKKYLDKQSLDTPALETYFTNETEIKLGLTGVYSSNYWTIGNLPIPVLYDLYTEIGIERTASIASGAFDPANATVQTFYTQMYTTVSRANVLLSGMQKGKATTTPATFDRMEAETKVLRAWAYYHLMGFFGDVVYYNQPLQPEFYYTLARSPKAKIIDSLFLDLDNAIVKLPWQPTERGRVSKGVAYCLKAKLALMDKRYQVAAEALNAVITGNQYSLNPVFGNLFKLAGQQANAGKEIMFEMVYPTNAANPTSFVALGQGSRALAGQSGRFPTAALVDRFETIEGKRIDESVVYDPANPSRNRDSRLKATVTMHGDTITAFAAGARRRAVFNIYNASTQLFNFTTNTWASGTNADFSNPFGPVNNGIGYLWAKYTYDDTDDMFASKLGFAFMRYAEILLTYAEAKIELGQMDATVINAINLVRRRAGIPDVAASITGNAAKMRQLVRRERTVELANEGIHLFDMRRWETGPLVLNTPAVYGAARLATVTAATPSFGTPGSVQDLNDISDYSASANTRFKREPRAFTLNKNNLWPVPQREIDINKNILQNPNW